MRKADQKPQHQLAWPTIKRLLRLTYRFRRQSFHVVWLHLLVLALSLGGLSLCGVGIDFLRHQLDASSPAPRWPLSISPPSHWPPLAVVTAIAAAVVLFAAINTLARYASAVAAANLSQGIMVQMRDEVYDRLQRLSFAYFDASQSSSLINRAAGDVQAVRGFVDGVVIKVFTVLLTLLVYVIYMLNVHVGLTVACLATTPLLWISSVVFSRAVQPAYRRVAVLVDRAISLLVENVEGVHVVKGFGRQQEETARFDRAVQDIRRERESIFRSVNTFQPFMGGLTQINMLVLIGYGGYLVIQGAIPLGAGMFVMANLLHEFAAQVGNITNIANTVQSSLIGAERVFEVLDAKSSVVNPDHPQRQGRASGTIEFSHVSFGYHPQQLVLRDLSLEVAVGQCLAIAGETGAGKSTLLSLVPRFYDTSSGVVRLDGVDVRQWDVDDLRRSVGMVFQETFLFSNTVAANIAFGHPAATAAQIQRAAELAAADEFISEMPGGYDAMIGEHGANLSGGQRQRLAIARALLLDPPLLILDDALAAVDAETEHEIQQAIESAMRNRTTLIVSNRISALRRADRIIVLQQGQIVQDGTHEQLLREPGYYRRLVQLQFGDLLQDDAATTDRRYPS